MVTVVYMFVISFGFDYPLWATQEAREKTAGIATAPPLGVQGHYVARFLTPGLCVHQTRKINVRRCVWNTEPQDGDASVSPQRHFHHAWKRSQIERKSTHGLKQTKKTVLSNNFGLVCNDLTRTTSPEIMVS